MAKTKDPEKTTYYKRKEMSMFKKKYLLVSCVIAVLGSTASNANKKKVYLTQKDFDSGTYRIKESGIYKLKEDIEFQPIPADQAKRTDKPGIGWFAVITVETDDVIIDLDGHIIQASQEFIDNHFFNLFSVVELANSQFPGPQFGTSFGTITTNFTGDTAYVEANEIIVKNGIVGRSGHFGIHGIGNSNVYLQDLHVKDWETSGIQLHGTQGGSLERIKITGLEHTINTRSTFVAVIVNRGFLNGLIAQNYSGADAQLIALDAFVAENAEMFFTPITTSDSSVFALLMTSGFSRDLPFPLTPEDCVIISKNAGTESERYIKFKDVSISDIHSSPIETVTIGSNNWKGDGFIDVQRSGLFGVFRWKDAFDQNSGEFAPNEFLKSTLFILKSQLELKPSLQSSFPPNIFAIIDSILNPNQEKFFANVQPTFGRNFNIVLNKGIFGFRIDCGEKIHMDKCSTSDITTNGAPGAELADLPGGDTYEFKQERYIGNDSWGFVFSSDSSFDIKNSSASNISSVNGGGVFGFDLLGSVRDTHIKSSCTHDLIGDADIIGQSVVNPPVAVYGFRIINCSPENILEDCSASKISSPRKSIAFAIESSDNNKVIDCQSYDIVVTSPHNLFEPEFAKKAIGYESAASSRSSFLNCRSSNVRIGNEQSVTTFTESYAAGFASTKDTFARIISCRTDNNHSGGGTAVGILLDGSHKAEVACTIIKNNIADKPFAKEYAIDINDPSTANTHDNEVNT